MRTRYRVHPPTHYIFAFFPKIPLRRGQHVLVDPIENEKKRCRVVRVKYSYEGTDYVLRRLVVVPDPLPAELEPLSHSFVAVVEEGTR